MWKDEQKTVPCEGCGKPLYIADEFREGDWAWRINDLWWCDRCARDEFRTEVGE